MASPAYELAQYLVGHGVGAFAADAGWSIAVSIEPARPDTTITLYDEAGEGPDTDELDIQRDGVRIRVRSPKGDAFLEAYAKHEEIRDLLIEDAPIVTGNSYFIGVKMTSGIAGQGKDDNERHVLVAFYEAEVQRAE